MKVKTSFRLSLNDLRDCGHSEEMTSVRPSRTNQVQQKNNPKDKVDAAKKRRPLHMPNEEVDDARWFESINIDDLIGDPVIFDFQPQVSNLRPINWNFKPLTITSQNVATKWKFPKQIFSISLALRPTEQQLPQQSTVRWNFKGQTHHPISNGTDWLSFQKQTPQVSSVNWSFISQTSNLNETNWSFVNQTDVIIPLDWYFIKALLEFSTIHWNFSKQLSDETTVNWDFSQQIPTSTPIKWTFRQQSQDGTRVPWKFRKNLVDMTPINWTFKHQPERQRSIKWPFTSLSGKKSAINWSFKPNLSKDIHTSGLSWNFKKNFISQTKPVSWNFSSKMQDIKPINWKMKPMTSSLDVQKSYDEISKENQTFKERYTLGSSNAHNKVNQLTSNKSKLQARKAVLPNRER